MKARHSYIGEVYTCQLSCNQNQQDSAYGGMVDKAIASCFIATVIYRAKFKSFLLEQTQK